MTTTLRLHSRQFVLAPRAVRVGSDWQEADVRGEDWTLSHDPHLSVVRTPIGLRIGNAANGAGRYCTIDGTRVTTDAAGLMGLYYGPDFVTSSPAIAELLGARHAPDRSLTWGGMDWNPGPPLVGVRRLLRDQALDLSDWSVSFRPEATITSVDAPLDMLCDTLTATGATVARDGWLILGLTAGLDSRTLLASLLAAGVKFECITQDFREQKADVNVARDICRYLNIKHTVVGAGRADPNAVDVWQRHCLASYNDADNNLLLPRDQYRFMADDSILVRGGVFEIGRRNYARTLNNLDFDNATGEVIFRRFENTAPDDTAVRSLDAWLDWRRAHPNGLEFGDAFYIDQRVGGWLGAIEQAMEILPGRTFHPAASLPVMQAMVSPDPADRAAGALQRHAIRRMSPELLRFPLNPEQQVPIVRRIKNRVSRLIGRQ